MPLATRIHILLTWMVVTGLYSCQGQSTNPVDIRQVSSRDLFRAAREHPTLLMVYGSNRDSDHQRMVKTVANINRESSRGMILLKKPDQLTANDLSDFPLLMLGNPGNNAWLKVLMEQLPFRLQGDTLEFDGHRFTANEHVLILSHFPNPYNILMPVSVITSLNDQLIADVLNRNSRTVFRGRWDYQVSDGNRSLLLGDFSQDVETRWEVDPERQLKLPSAPTFHGKEFPYTYYTYHAKRDSTILNNFIAARAAEYDNILKKLQLSSKHLPDLQFYLYPSTELKGLMLGNTLPCQTNYRKNTVHAVANHLVCRNLRY